MRLDALPVTFSLALLLCVDYALAAPSSPDPPPSRSLHIPIVRRAVPQRNETELGIWAKQQKLFLEAKYGQSSGSSSKRSTGYNMLVNQNTDSSYYGTIAIGTPPVAYNVILDTGSADLFLVGSGCASQACNGIPAFDSSASSTFSSNSQSFSITYGSGSASGTLGTDVVQMAGFQVNQQTFATCDQVTSGLLTAPVSGIMGLGWQGLASSRATPFWQSLFQGNVWDQPLMAVYLTRFQNASRPSSEEPGGVFTMGATNSSLFTGQIDFQSVQNIQSNTLSYWTLPITSLTVNGGSVSLPSGSSSLAAIDTGTTLIGGPSDQVAAVYAQIPGSAAATGNYDGYFTYPCSTNVNVSIAFGGQTWSISPADFKLQQVSSSQCLGSVFTFSSNSNTVGPAWIVGDTFLKNVYTVFRANPASVGFAALASDAQSLVTQEGVPTPTVGSVSASVTSSGRKSNVASPSVTMPYLMVLLSLCIMGSTSFFYLL